MGGGIRSAVAAATWLIAGLSFAELVRGMVAVGQVGGYCRDGGAILSAIPCPDGTTARILLSAVGLAVAVIANVAFAKGFGPDLPAVVIPGLFAVAGVVFLLGGLAPVRVDLLLPGVLFLVIGGVMLWLNRESGWLRLAIGSRLADGRAIAHRSRPLYHRSVPHPGEAKPNPAQAAGLAAIGYGPFALGLVAGVLI